MKKIRFIGLAAFAAVMSGQVHALTLAQIASAKANGTLIEVHVSGSSALSSTIGGLLTQNCAAGTLDIYLSDINDPAFSGDATNGTSVKAYSCQIGEGRNNFMSRYYGRFIVFQKSDQGGSGNGVFPVAYSRALPFLNLVAAQCNATTKVCKSAGFTRAPDAGVSDVSPTAFNPESNRPLKPINFSDKGAFPDVTFLNFSRRDSVVQTIFGMAVSQPLYAALQADQGVGTGRPSLPKAVIASMLSNSFDPAIRWAALLPNSAPAVHQRQINICREVNGSGAQAAANRFFGEYPTNPAALLPADNLGNSEFPNSIGHVGNAGSIMVYEGSTMAHVRDCLNKANDVNAFAIGHVSLENAETVKWKFARIDGAEASRDNAKKGFYHYVFESTIQVRNSANYTPKSFLSAFIDTIHYPVISLNLLSTAAQNGVMALPMDYRCTSDFGSYAVNSAEAKFCSRVRRIGNEPLTIVR